MTTPPRSSVEPAPAEGFRPEPGSFRDPDSRVLVGGGAVLRALSRAGAADWHALAATEFFSRFTAEGRVVATEEVAPPAEGLPTGFAEPPAALLRHERIPVVSYPYEWPFGMLRDAALLQLELLLAALGEGMVLKDASPYNVQWRGAVPVFVDVGSFERLREGEPWMGYRQFCMLYLYPLLLQAYKGVPFQAWLRGSIDGISPAECAAVMSLRDRLRRGVLAHVVLHARLERRYAARAGEVRRELRRSGFGKELIEANVRRLHRLVGRLDWTPPATVWTEYGRARGYVEADAERKAAFVREVARSRRWGIAWDLGCNDARFARIAAEGARAVVAIDADHGTVEHVYRALKADGETAILPLTMNVADPSPGLGWRGLERRPLPDRAAPDLVLALALVHHLSIAGNIPVRELVDWLHGLGATLVVEFVRREDPMVERLLAAKRPGAHPDYEQGFFERCLEEAFSIERTETLGSGTRVLYLARPHGGGARSRPGRGG